MRHAFLVDGFNLYHSLNQAHNDFVSAGTPKGTKWLDLGRFCASFLYMLGGNARMGPIHYFSALARHMEARKPDVTLRHEAYIRCLADSGVIVEMSQFKEKWSNCHHCGREITRHEEKETDVGIGVRLIELLMTNQCDAAVLVSADSDLAPAIRTAGKLFPGRPIYCVKPYARGSFDLDALCARHFRAKKERYATHQFPDPFICKDGTSVPKPAVW